MPRSIMPGVSAEAGLVWSAKAKYSVSIERGKKYGGWGICPRRGLSAGSFLYVLLYKKLTKIYNFTTK